MNFNNSVVKDGTNSLPRKDLLRYISICNLFETIDQLNPSLIIYISTLFKLNKLFLNKSDFWP